LGVESMTILEKKIDAIARSLLANDTTDRNAALGELAVLMEKPENTAQDVDSIIRKLLLELGVPEHILGSRYLVKAIREVVEDESKTKTTIKCVYSAVAEAFDTTWRRTERAIRHGIELAWDRGDIDVLNKYFGGTISPVKGKPTNSEFIARCANIVRAKL